MPNYQKMYAIVCAAASDAVDFIRAGKAVHAEHTLLLALRRAEETYLSENEESRSTNALKNRQSE